MSKYIFIYVDEQGTKTSTRFDVDHIDEVVRNFRYFLSGASFHDLTIKNALLGIAEEISDDKE